jgi:serine protease Do
MRLEERRAPNGEVAIEIQAGNANSAFALYFYLNWDASPYHSRMEPRHFGMASDLMSHCSMANSIVEGRIVERSLMDFFNKYHTQYGTPARTLSTIAQRLASEGWLVWSGTARGAPPLNARYFSGNIEPREIAYKTFDFIAFGFPAIRLHFEEAVRVLFVKAEMETNGSGFLVETGQLITAAHCVTKKCEVRIPGWDATTYPLKEIRVHNDPRVDVAVLTFVGNPFSGIPGFRLRAGEILEPVMTLGYPPIPGFRSVLVAEVSEVCGKLLSSEGQVVAAAQAYLDQQEYLIISARVKGGSSGGPVVAKDGKVIGVVAQMPAGSGGNVDPLTYGAVIPTAVVETLLAQGANSCSQILEFTATESGFSTSC